MEDLQLTETEQRYFGDLFLLCCDTENTGKVPLFKACELFRTSKVSPKTISQITDLCSGGKSSHLGRKQFYIALKLIAASQAGVSVHHPDLVNSIADLPLPKFVWTNDEINNSQTNVNSDSPDLIELGDSNALKSASTDQINSSDGEQDGLTDKQNSPKNLRSPGASSTASDSPTPTNSVQEKSWATPGNWQGLVSEEQRQLLGTEEESSDRHSSEDEVDRELWTITSEQRDYYTKQFRSLQPDPNGLLAGSIARLFFEMSKLPVQELRKIWQLSDVTKDGALSLEEFNVAMHLVVLRRNNIPLPDSLPPFLVPTNPSPVVVPPVPLPREDNSPGQSSISSEPRGSKQWTKFVDSPTSSIASPGPKPVNFDFHKSAVEQDPKIYHPVPVRVTPEAPSNMINAEDGTSRSPRRLDYENIHSDNNTGKKPSAPCLSQDGASDLRPIQRPQPRKPPPGPGAIPPPPQHLVDESLYGPTSLPVCIGNHMAPKKEPPPPPPPRPCRTHARSSSLDLNKLGKSSSLAAPPAVPPRISPSSSSPKKLIGQRSEGDVISLVSHVPTFADFSHFPGSADPNGEADLDTHDGPPRRHGAFQVYRKHTKYESPPTEAPTIKQQGNTRQDLEERNNVLTRLCYELIQELAQVQEERNALQVKLEQLQSSHCR
ncbi:UNVERIFIED_CONTAM: hypothetical protein PYX00_002894 [Menopon gallinae]|uniref:RalBP1-associated Eps domain-containing protein 1 n=1 Tax=Menopon gallinae TaxID=328185 RepID=A0AAW2HYE1_9NEOP